MRGSSGARIESAGDFIKKTCRDARYQVEWFERAIGTDLVQGLVVPYVESIDDGSYHVEYVEGHLLCREPSLHYVSRLIDQVSLWSHEDPIYRSDWDGYLSRLEDHVRVSGSEAMTRALSVVERSEPFVPSFCHGDLTFENLLVRDDDLVMIDPNSGPDLYSSFILDLGKILQSTHSNYHNRFDSNPGVDLTRHNQVVCDRLSRLGLLDQASVAELSHVMRFRKYRPDRQRPDVDDLLMELITELR